MSRVVLVPSTLLLLPEYAGQVDPVPELRSAVLEAVATLGDGPVRVVAAGPRPDNVARGVIEAAGVRIARRLLGREAVDGAAAVLVVANGSACRTEKAPGHLDERAEGFDATIEKYAVQDGRHYKPSGNAPYTFQMVWHLDDDKNAKKGAKQ